MEMGPFGDSAIRASAIGIGCARIGGFFQSGPAGFPELLGAAAPELPVPDPRAVVVQ